MRPRPLPLLLVLAAAPAPAGDGQPEPDAFLAALAGKAGPDAVAAPEFDAEAEAASWSLRPRRRIVDALAARLLRGEARWAAAPPQEPPALRNPPSRNPADFEPGTVAVSDRLAAWVPADAAAVFFDSLDAAETAAGELAKFLPRALPVLCEEPASGSREALRRGFDMLLLPTIWRSNPQVRTGTRQVALVVSDPDVRWAPDVAFVAEVDDASLVRFHRRSSLSWEDRGARRIRVDGLDAVADDGSVRSFFAQEGGVAVWSTTKTLRERILAAAAGTAPSLATPPAAACALSRRTFPAKGGGALLVVPDGFLARADGADLRGRRLAALRCEAARLLLDARSLRKGDAGMDGGPTLACPSGGALSPRAGTAGSSCPIHGTAEYPAPLGDLPPFRGALPPPVADPVARGAVPVAARWRPGILEVLVPPGAPARGVLDCLGLLRARDHAERIEFDDLARLRTLGGDRHPDAPSDSVAGVFRALTGLRGPPGSSGAARARFFGDAGPDAMAEIGGDRPPDLLERGGVLEVRLAAPEASRGDLFDPLVRWR